ncbi:hypothetical protein G7072_00265 [Nocardioides sp. HDW12B]|uniref:arsenate reductase/protein-tyrosine-phosphatase family protein n=1 Tax=Nocardioides sp. HDW12B TaxID=2714939 RepID=UPI00140A0FDE|nr:hypothetical protein [Nocardioides sp. HDW12B]QIK64976.1 hypothetical protein G7072_00265 [Nocardioides sp. HDW12B]
MSQAGPYRVLTVCLGNICRSPLAERLLATRLNGAAEGGFAVSSAGVIGMIGRSMEPAAAAQLERLGGNPSGFVARRLDVHHVRNADLVLTATVDVRRQALEEAPGALRRTFTLLEFAALCSTAGPELRGRPRELVADAAVRRATVGGQELDIPDPMGRSDRTHARVADLIDGAVETIVAALTSRGSRADGSASRG